MESVAGKELEREGGVERSESMGLGLGFLAIQWFEGLRVEGEDVMGLGEGGRDVEKCGCFF